MSDKAVSRNLTKYVKVGPNQWQHCPVVRGKTGRIRQNLVLVHGRIENHPEGYYSLEWRDNGKRRRLSLGKDAANAQLATEREVAHERARALGLER
jgi:hypothetical protein